MMNECLSQDVLNYAVGSLAIFLMIGCSVITFIESRRHHELIRLEPSHGPAIEFVGKRIASAMDNAGGLMSLGTVYKRFILYETVGGSYVCWRWERDPLSTDGDACCIACASPKEVFAFFGDSRLARKLYQEAGLASPSELRPATFVS